MAFQGGEPRPDAPPLRRPRVKLGVQGDASQQHGLGGAGGEGNIHIGHPQWMGGGYQEADFFSDVNISHHTLSFCLKGFCLDRNFSQENVAVLWASRTVDGDRLGLNWLLVSFCFTSVGEGGGGR